MCRYWQCCDHFSIFGRIPKSMCRNRQCCDHFSSRRKDFYRLLWFIAQFNRSKSICKKTKESPQKHFAAAILTECGSRCPFRKMAYPLRTEKLLMNIKIYVEGNAKYKRHQRFAETSRKTVSSIFECSETNQRYALQDVKKEKFLLWKLRNIETNHIESPVLFC